MSRIDNLYGLNDNIEYDKSQYYLGKIVDVYFNGGLVQTENMSLLKYRLNHLDTLIPNTIGYIVVIDSISGLYLGQIVNAKLKDSDSIHDAVINDYKDILHPNLKIKALGIYKDDRFQMNGNKTFGIGDKVYVANREILKKYSNSIQISKGKNNKENLEFSSMNVGASNSVPFEISTDNLLDHHLMVIGATNSGKSTSSLAILNQMNLKNKKFLIIDPTGEYKKSFLEDKNVDCKFIGKDLFLNTASITDEQWISILHPNQNSQEYFLIDAIHQLKFKKSIQIANNIENDFVKVSNYVKNRNENIIDYEGCTLDELKIMQSFWKNEHIKNESFEIKYLPRQIEADSLKLQNNKTTNYQNIMVFDAFTYGTNAWLIRKIDHLIAKYKIDKLFLSSDCIEQNNAKSEFLDKALSRFLEDEQKSLYIGFENSDFSDIGTIIINYISDYILENNIKKNPFAFFIDEVHRYAKEKNEEGEYTTSLINIAREGRKDGIFLFLTTQSPKDVPDIILNQIGTLLVHRLTGKNEVNSISNYLDNDSIQRLAGLNRGQAILAGVNLIHPVFLEINESGLDQNNKTPQFG